MNIPDAPDIRMTEATGYPTPVSWPHCPLCGEECETIYKDYYGDVVGCENCIETSNAWELSNENK